LKGEDGRKKRHPGPQAPLAKRVRPKKKKGVGPNQAWEYESITSENEGGQQENRSGP